MNLFEQGGLQTSYTYRCPSGCVWESRYIRLQPAGFWGPPDGIACPIHRLYAGRDGRRRLRPFWARNQG